MLFLCVSFSVRVFLLFLVKNGLFIGGGVGGDLAAVGAVLYVRKRRQ